MISYHIVTSFGISYSVIACSRAYLVKLVAHIWLSLKASGEKGSKSEKIQKIRKERQAFKQEPKEKESQASKHREFMKRNTCAKDTWKGKPTLACI